MTHRHLAIVVLCSACAWLPTHAQAAPSPFRLEGDRLIVTTGKLELVLQHGAVVMLRDLGTGEYFAFGDQRDGVRTVPSGAAATADGWSFHQAWYKGGPARYAADKKLQDMRRRPLPGVAPILKPISATEAEVTYTKLTGGTDGDAIRYRVAIDATTQEVLLTGDVRLADPEAPPQSLDLAFVNLKSPAVVLGCGTRIAATVPKRRIDYCIRSSNNLYSPAVAVLEGYRGVAALFPELPTARLNIYLAHAPETDDAVVFQSGIDPRHDKAVVRAAPLRVGVYGTWVDAARRYRERFQALTGAKPLWEQTPTWVRKIHAVHTSAPGGGHGNPKPEEAQAYYSRLAKIVPSEALLLFYWNGNGIVVFGDHRYMTKLGWPKPHVVKALKSHGFHWLGYHPYTLLMPAHAIKARFERIREHKWGIPEGYTFTPDYGGPPEKFFDYFRPVSTGYYKPIDEARLWVYHPGSAKGRAYFVHNFRNYCKFHNADGNYMDVAGADADHHFPPEKKVIEDMTCRMGEDRMLREAREKLPELAMMSEVQSSWSVAHTFYTWEGASHYTHARAYASNDSIVNHPLRAALWGSYCWTRESVLQPDESALMGSLPALHLDDPWSIARARLFAKEELFNDLPKTWDPEALACFRAKGGRWFQFRRLPYGDGYVEIKGKRQQVHLGRFTGVTESPLKTVAWIPGWQACNEGKPFGLNPARTYPFISQKPDGQGDYSVAALPAGAFVGAFRNHAKGWSTVEFGLPTGELRQADVTIAFRRKCLRVCDALGEHAGPFEAGTRATFHTRVPGALVLVWDKPKAQRGHRRNALLEVKGKLNALGLDDPRWCQRSHCRVVSQRIGTRELSAIEVGSGRHRGYIESWVTLHPEGDPVLRFEIGYPKPQRHRTVRIHAFTVRVNGREIWREHVGVTKQWLPRAVPLGLYKGRTVVLTLSVEELTDQDVGPSHVDPPSLFGNVYVDGNPISFGPVDGAALARPAKVLFTDFLAAPAGKAESIDKAWTVVNSPANPDPEFAPKVSGGMLVLPGRHYKHQYLARALPEPNPVVQARVQTPLTGGSQSWQPGIGLYWSKGGYAFITAGAHRETDASIVVRGAGQRTIPLGERAIRILDDNSCDCWVRIEVDEKTVRYASSLDGKTWHVEREVARPKAMAGPPKLLVVGRGSEGKAEVFQNDLPHNMRAGAARIGQLVVGSGAGPSHPAGKPTR